MTAIDRTFEMLREELHGLREDNARQFGGLRAEMVGMRADLARVQDRMIQIGFGMAGPPPRGAALRSGSDAERPHQVPTSPRP
jgi:hypothetical protein